MFISKKLLAIAAASLLGTALAFPASAETISGQLEDADQNSIFGWVWDKEDYNHILNVELHIYPAGSEKEIVTLTTKADFYRDDLQTSIGDGYHGFTCPIDWNTLEGNEFSVIAYAVSEQGKTQLAETISYKKISVVEPMGTQPVDPGSSASTQTGSPMVLSGNMNMGSGILTPGQSTGPGYTASPSPSEPVDPGYSSSSSTNKPVGPGGPGSFVPEPEKETAKKGESLGLYFTSGYCTCEICSSGESLTFSGTVPQANHTISADLTILPLNTKVIIDDIVYTVEDKGSSVVGNRIDIYYDSHEEAVAHGLKEVEVFLVKEQ